MNTTPLNSTAINAAVAPTVFADGLVQIDPSVDVTPGTIRTWVTVDVSAHVPDNAAAVGLYVVNDGLEPATVGARHPSSAVDHPNHAIVMQAAHGMLWAAVSSNGEVALYMDPTFDPTRPVFHLTQYITADVASFPQDSVDLSVPGGGWQETDVSAIGSAGWLFALLNPFAAEGEYGIRPDGSDAALWSAFVNSSGAMVGTYANPSGLIEQHAPSDGDSALRGAGILTGALGQTPPIDITPSTTGTWEVADVSGFLLPDATHAIVVTNGAWDTDQFGWRRTGETGGAPRIFHGVQAWIIPLDENNTYEQQVTGGAETYLVGYIHPPPVPGSLLIHDTSESIVFSGTVTNAGSLALADSPETVAFTGTILNTGSLDLADAGESIAFSGNVRLGGSLGLTDAGEDIGLSGTSPLSGSLAVTDGGEIIRIEESPSDVISGTLSLSDAGEQVSFQGQVHITGTLELTDLGETILIEGSVPVTATLSVTDAPELVSIKGRVKTSGLLAVTDQGESISFIEIPAPGLATLDVTLRDILILDVTLTD